MLKYALKQSQIYDVQIQLLQFVSTGGAAERFHEGNGKTSGVGSRSVRANMTHSDGVS